MNLRNWPHKWRPAYLFFSLFIPFFSIWHLFHVTQVGAATNFTKNQQMQSNNEGQFLPIFFASKHEASRASDIAWGDFDGDGDLDLAFAVPHGGRSQIYVNEGSDGFRICNIDYSWFQTEAIAWGDVDGDGDLELALGNNGSENYIFGDLVQKIDSETGKCLIQNRKTPIPGSEGTVTKFLSWGDFDGDGFLDLAVANKDDVNQLYKNNGNGGLNLVPENPLGSNEYNTTSLSWGDFDNDNDLDLAIGNYEQVNELFINSDGKGDFEPSLNLIGTTRDSTTAIEWGHFNGDEKLDLVVGNHRSSSILLLSDTDQDDNLSYAGYSIPGTSSRLTNDIAIGDINRDGQLDIIFANGDNLYDSGNIYSTKFPQEENQLFLGDGHGTLIESTLLTTPSHSQNSNAITLGDMDGDGDLDLAEANGHWSNMIAENTLKLSFTLRDDFSDGAHLHSWYVASGDVNNDGYVDFALTDGIYINKFGKLFRAQNLEEDEFRSDRCGTLISTEKAWIDINSDGYLDLVSTLGNIYLNDGTGQLNIVDKVLDWRISNYCWEKSAIAIEDLNGDSRMDIIFHKDNPSPRNGQPDMREPPRIYLNRPENDGKTFSDLLVFDEVILPEEYRRLSSYDIATGDLDGNGFVDLLFTDQSNFRTPTIVNDQKYYHGTVIFYNNGNGFVDQNGKFEFEREYHFQDSGGATGAKAVEIADFDSDGDLDIVLVSVADRYFENNGSGIFNYVADAFLTPITGSTQDIASGDIDQDGDIDIILAEAHSSGFTAQNFQPKNSIYLNNGEGTFDLAPIDSLFKTDDTYSVNLTDVDNDGDLDAIFGSFNSGSYWYENLRVNQSDVENQPPTVYIGRPSDNSILTSSYTPHTKLSGRFIPIPFKLFDFEADPIVAIRAEYSLNGGDNWQPAIAHPETITTNLRTFPQSMSLDRAYVRIPHNDSLNIDTSFTIEMWVAPLSFPSGNNKHYLLHKPNLFGLRLVENGQLEWSVGDSNIWRRPIADITEREWSHIVLAFEPVMKTAYLYLDGEIVDSRIYTNAPTFSNNEDLWIGHPASSNFDEAYHGFVRNVRLWKNHRSAEQIKIGQFERLDRNSISLLGYWPLNNLDNAVTKDLSRNNNHGNVGRSQGGVFPELVSEGANHVFYWDTFKSGFFGESENVIFRINAYPQSLTSIQLEQGIIRYPNQTADSSSWAFTTASSFPFRARGTQIRVVMEDAPTVGIENAIVFYRDSEAVEATLLNNEFGVPVQTNANGYLEGRPPISSAGQMIALMPDPEPTDAERQNIMKPWQSEFRWIDFTDSYTYLYTSGNVNDDSQLEFSDVSLANNTSVQTLTVSAENKLLLFHLNVSLEWDARNDPLFLLELEESFKQASALLYDVSDGQVALGRINLFHDKAYWGNADVVIFADNSLRPSASIGGIISNTLTETLKNPNTGEISLFPNAYGPGQVRMGTVWDSFGERTADLGEEWTRALAHELAHYLLFLPDNYLGFEDGILRPANCPGSFMSNNSDLEYSEFLARMPNWELFCQETLAQNTTGRADWETIETFYTFLNIKKSDPHDHDHDFDLHEHNHDHDEVLTGPVNLPLAVTHIVPWAFEKDPTALPSRNYLVRDERTDEILRLPNAQVYLFKTQGTLDLTDDVIIYLGSPTGGGNRINVRGADSIHSEAQNLSDRLCLFDFSRTVKVDTTSDSDLGDTFGSCQIIDTSISSISVSTIDNDWNPLIAVSSNNGVDFEIKVVQEGVSESEKLFMQVFPLHYASIPTLAPTSTMQLMGNEFVATVELPLPAYEVAVRVWKVEEGVEGGISEQLTKYQSVSFFKINPTDWVNVNAEDIIEDLGYVFPDIVYYPIFGPANTPVGGPANTPVGGPANTPVGGPANTPVGGPSKVPFSGPANTPVGGPANTPVGGPANTPVGGPFVNASASRSVYAPILSADAQIVIYNTVGFFEDNGIRSLQELQNIPEIERFPWLVPVGQAYYVEHDPLIADTRYISFNYLQRDVPEGYEYALKIYFLEDCPEGEIECNQEWLRISNTEIISGNIIAAPMQTINDGNRGANGTYAVMATVEMPELRQGWNLFAYTMPDCRKAETALVSLGNNWDGSARVAKWRFLTFPSLRQTVTHFEAGSVYWVRILDAEAITPYLAPPIKSADGVINRNCNTAENNPSFLHSDIFLIILIYVTFIGGSLLLFRIFRKNRLLWSRKK